MKTTIIISLIIALSYCNFTYGLTECYLGVLEPMIYSKDSLSKIYFKADKMPKPAGCDHALSDELSDKFGSTLQYKNGKVKIQFIVNEKGSIDDVYLLESNYPEINNKVLEIFSSLNTKWEPGEQCGMKVKVSMTCKIIFKNGWMKFMINNEPLL